MTRQEAIEALDRIWNFCEEISEENNYRMLEDVLALQDFLSTDAIPVKWIKKWLEWGQDSIQQGRYLGAVSAMLSDWSNEVDIEKPIR